MDIIKFDHKLRANCECIIQMNSKEAAVNAVNSDKLRQYPFLVEVIFNLKCIKLENQWFEEEKY